jgi:hypothetical protein
MLVESIYTAALNLLSKELVALDRPRRDVLDAAQDIGDFKPDQAEGHVGEALALLREAGHARVQVGIVDVKRLWLC